jgi:hypothetical protein
MCHKPIAGSESGSLEYIIQYQQYGENDYQYIDEIRALRGTCNPMADIGAESENEIDDGTGGKAYCQMPAGIGSVGNEPINEFGNAIDEAHKGQDYSETGICDAEFLS